MFPRRPNRPPDKANFRRSRAASGIASWWTIWRVPILLAIVSAGWWFLYRPYVEDKGWTRVTASFALCGERWNGAQGCVIDGDTILLGNGQNRRRIRITGFDAPELDGACEAESSRARQARKALHEWLGQGPFEWTGESAPPRDQYGRELREIRRRIGDARYDYLAEHMIAADLAAESGWGSWPQDWCT